MMETIYLIANLVKKRKDSLHLSKLMIMKNLTFLFILMILTYFKSSAQKVYYTNSKSDADLVVYEVEQKTDADIIVKKVIYNDEVKKGFWKEVETRGEADIVVFISDENTTDIKKIYFTEYNDEVNY